jgi:flagellar hook-associated protein 3 FlgL
MLSPLTPPSQQFLADVNRTQQQIAVANEQVSSGRKVNVASDEPDVISNLLQLRANMQQNSQVTTNLGSAATDANVAESALSSATQLMDTAVSLAAQGATATTDAAGRQSIAQQVQAILQEMVSYSQTQSSGRYVFSGDSATQPTYQVDLSSGNGVDQLITPGASRQVQDPAGGSFAVSQTAQQIFDDRNSDGSYASDNVFGALTNLYNGLMNNDTNAITASATSLKSASDHLNVSLSFYGNVQKRLQDATNYASNYNVQLTTQIGQLQDADIAAASLELTQGTTQLQASFAGEAKIPQSTLFDYLTSNG